MRWRLWICFLICSPLRFLPLRRFYAFRCLYALKHLRPFSPVPFPVRLFSFDSFGFWSLTGRTIAGVPLGTRLTRSIGLVGRWLGICASEAYFRCTPSISSLVKPFQPLFMVGLTIVLMTVGTLVAFAFSLATGPLTLSKVPLMDLEKLWRPGTSE